jgi:hypothetical protein
MRRGNRVVSLEPLPPEGIGGVKHTRASGVE